MTLAHGPDERAAALDEAFRFDDVTLVERYLAGARDIEVAVIGNEPDALELYGPGEILSGHEFYDYAAKYTPGLSQTTTTAEVTPASARRCSSSPATRIGPAAAEGFARIDFLLAGEELVISEINTIPGFTPISLFPTMPAGRRLRLRAVCRRVVDLALERHAGRVRHRLTAADLPALTMVGRKPSSRKPIGTGVRAPKPSALRPGAPRRRGAPDEAGQARIGRDPDAGPGRRRARAPRRGRRAVRRDGLGRVHRPHDDGERQHVDERGRDPGRARGARRPERVHARDGRPRGADRADPRRRGRRGLRRAAGPGRGLRRRAGRPARLGRGRRAGSSSTRAGRCSASSPPTRPRPPRAAARHDRRVGVDVWRWGPRWTRRRSTRRSGSGRSRRPTSAAAATRSGLGSTTRTATSSTASRTAGTRSSASTPRRLRTTELIPGQVRLLRSLLLEHDEATVQRVILADERQRDVDPASDSRALRQPQAVTARRVSSPERSSGRRLPARAPAPRGSPRRRPGGTHPQRQRLLRVLALLGGGDPRRTGLGPGGGPRGLDGVYDNRIFISGFLTNAIVAVLLTFIGDRLSLDLYLVALINFGFRIFNNVALIRRHFI